MKIKNDKHKICMILILVVVLWGLNAVAIKYLTLFFPPMALAPIRLCLASILLVPVILLQKGPLLPPRKAWLPIAAISLFSIFLHQSYEWKPLSVLLFSSFMSTALGALLWNMSIKQVGASTASLFQNASPIVGVMASVVFLGEQLSWHHVAALSLIILGVSIGTGILPLPRFHRKQALIKG